MAQQDHPAGRPSARVLLVHGRTLVRSELATVLGATPGLELAGQCATSADAAAQVLLLRPHVVVADVRLPDGSGLDLCRHLVGTDGLAVVLTSAFDTAALRRDALAAGASGMVVTYRAARVLAAVVVAALAP
ncbi:response regulator [Arthrobacter sp. NEB 688]|uniref:response regulator n=1 Tax=Arthrobacter sp. NEB 688 TaxID=904039 RepID=UPI00156480E1|nr:response regulator [Arthrobacter sp. NEB 688]QKE84490.1 response regulator [Arthrobacter sp. NEB 688]